MGKLCKTVCEHEPLATPASLELAPAALERPASCFEHILGIVGSGRRQTRQERWLEKHVGAGATGAVARIRLGVDFCRACMGLRFRWRRVPLTFRLIARQCEKEARYARPLFGTGRACRRGENFRLAARYVSFASAAYQPMTEKEIAQPIRDLGPQNIKHIHKGTGVMCPNFFIAVDPITDAVVVCIRGTACVADALTNVLSRPTPFQGGTAHFGFLQMAKQVAGEAMPMILELLQASPGRKVAFAGHSLGGATAILATLQLFGPGTEHHDLMAEGRVRCFAFGPPPVLSMPAALPAYVTASIHTFVHNFDAVPRASPVALCKLIMAMEAVDRLPISRLQRLRGQAPKHELPDFVEMSQTQEAELGMYLGKYYHTGQLVLLRCGEDGMAVCEELAREVTERFLVHPDMFTDHWAGNYEHLIAKLAPSRPSLRRSYCKSFMEMHFTCDAVPLLSRQRTVLRAVTQILYH